MSGQRHICRGISENKRRAYLGWVNGLDGSPKFNDFASLCKSGYISSIVCDLANGNKDTTLVTLLSDYYGANFVDGYIVDSIGCVNCENPTAKTQSKCSCVVEFHTAMVVALLLNIALNNKDPRHVHICMKLTHNEQEEIAKTFNFLATEAGERPPPTETDWKSFLFSPITECQQTPVAPRRGIQPRLLVGGTTAGSSPSSRTGAASADQFSVASSVESDCSSIHSPIVESRASPVVRSTAKLREKEVAIQRLRRDVAEKAHLSDLQSFEISELKTRLEAAENVVAMFKGTESELRAEIRALQVREEQLVADLAKARELEKQVQSLASELQKTKIDKEIFAGLEKERDTLYAELESLTNERDNLEKEMEAANLKAQRTLERLQVITETHRSEMESLIKKNEHLVGEIRKLRDAIDEQNCKEEELNRATKEADLLRQRMAELSEKYTGERNSSNETIARLESEARRFHEESKQLKEQMMEINSQSSLLEKQVQALHQQKSSVQEENNSLLSRIHALETEVVKLEGLRKKGNEEIALLETKIAHLEGQNRGMEHERTGLIDKMALLERQVSKLEMERNKGRTNFACQASMEVEIEKQLTEKIMTLEEQLRQVTNERDKLLTAQESQNKHDSVLYPSKRTRRESAHSTVSTATFGGGVGNSSVTSTRCHSRIDTCEDEDDGMMENALAPGEDGIRLKLVPAQRSDSGITPGRQILPVSTAEESNLADLFKSPLPLPVVRSLHFHADEHSMEEVWSDGSILDKLEDKELDVSHTPWDKRLSTLNLRNKQLPPHLKSSYPLETQLLPIEVRDDDLKNAPNYEPPSSVMDAMTTPKSEGPNKSGQEKTVVSQKAKGSFATAIAERLRSSESKATKRAAKEIKDGLPSNAKTTNNSVGFEVCTSNAPPRKTMKGSPFKKKESGVQSILSGFRKKQ